MAGNMALNEFWVQPAQAISDLAVQSIYTFVQDQMREELDHRKANIVDQMLAERTCFLYAHIRQRESMTNAKGEAAFANDRARKETLQLWAQMAENLQRRWTQQDQANANQAILDRLAGAVDKALLDMDPTVAANFRELLTDALEEAGL